MTSAVNGCRVYCGGGAVPGDISNDLIPILVSFGFFDLLEHSSRSWNYWRSSFETLLI